MVDIEATWNFGDPADSESRFLALAKESESSLERAILWTQVARARGLQRQFDQAEDALIQARTLHPEPADELDARFELERGRIKNSSGDSEGAIPNFSKAADIALKSNLEFLRVDALHMLGIADSANSLKWYLLAIEEARNAQSEKARGWLGSLYNNTGWTYFEARNLEKALETFELAVEKREEQGDPMRLLPAKWAVARCLREMGRAEEALTIQRELAVIDPNDPYVQEEIALLEA